MIAFSKINKQYGKQVLFVDASFQLNEGEKVGLVATDIHHRNVQVTAAAEAAEVRLRDAVAHEVEGHRHSAAPRRPSS